MAPPNKRQPKMTTQTLLDFDLGESSSDSDFRIEDHDETDDDFSDSKGGNSEKHGKSDDDDSDSDDDDSDGDTVSSATDLKQLLAEPIKPATSTKTEVICNDIVAKAVATCASSSSAMKEKLSTKPICCACLGDRSDDANEIVECDGCGVSVHEGCYGVSDSASISSTTSSCSTEPWFCEACRAGETNPICEICPNRGGIFKETDVGKWVHLVCALYVPGVAFGEVDHLSSVTLFEMPYSKWGTKTCTLCENERYARTGVCIGCDAGMCKTYFHVTCAQAAGFLSEAHSDEADHADPFYAHCKVHSDKTMIKHRKRNFHILKFRTEQQRLEKLEKANDELTPEQVRIQRKLTKYHTKYKTHKTTKKDPWVPTQKMSRLLPSSATACNRFAAKAKVLDVDIEALERKELQIAAITDVRKKWHVQPALSVEFIAYYIDRITRIQELKTNLDKEIQSNEKYQTEQNQLRSNYDENVTTNTELKSKNEKLQDSIRELHKQIETLCPNKGLPSIENIGRPVVAIPSPVPQPAARPMAVPTAAALKMGVGFPLAHLPGTKDDTGRILSTQSQNKNELVHDCGICKRCTDQHLLAKCDTCHFYYHLGCLNPPLTRHPKKSKLYGWQCSECDKSDDSEGVVDVPKGPRKSRTRFSKDGTIVPVDQSLSSSNPDMTMSPKGVTKRKSIDVKIPAKRKTLEKSLDSALNGKMSGSESDNINFKKKTIINKSITSHDKVHETALNLSKKTLTVDLTALPNDRLSPKIKNPKLKNLEVIINNVAIAHVNAELVEPVVIPIHACNQDDLPQIDPLAGADPISLNSLIPLVNLSNSTIACTNTDSSSIVVTDQSIDQISKHNRKKRKDKHKNKYSSDNEKSPTKEHKRKRKKKSHDMENPNDMDRVPKIKVKFKTLPLPGEAAPEPHFFYVSADMVRPMERSRPTSVETVEDSVINVDDVSQPAISPQPNDKLAQPSAALISPAITSTPKPIRQPRISANRNSRLSSSNASCSNLSLSSPQKGPANYKCDVCNQMGTNQNIVICDECRKNYHFECLDPPVKKTPKRRGYSWHCADCDPTDAEME